MVSGLTNFSQQLPIKSKHICLSHLYEQPCSFLRLQTETEAGRSTPFEFTPYFKSPTTTMLNFPYPISSQSTHTCVCMCARAKRKNEVQSRTQRTQNYLSQGACSSVHFFYVLQCICPIQEILNLTVQQFFEVISLCCCTGTLCVLDSVLMTCSLVG